MKKKKEPKSRWGLCVIICLVALSCRGCGDPQSPERMDVHGLRAHLLCISPETDPNRPDRWKVSTDTQGRDICGVAHGFMIELLDASNQRLSEEEVRIDIEPVSHWSPVGYGDLWDQPAPNGKKYGFLNVFPEAGSGIYDGVLHGRTTDRGLLLTYAGLGDPKTTSDPAAPLDLGYEWPGPGGSYNDCVDTVVQLKISIPGKGPPVQPIDVWCWYVRAQYQNFWEPEGGVYHWSIQGTGGLTSGSSLCS